MVGKKEEGGMIDKANDRQVGGDHYRKSDADQQHWDYCWARKFDQFQYQITKYVERWRDKNGIADLEKAKHFLEKYIELVKAGDPFALVPGELQKSSQTTVGHVKEFTLRPFDSLRGGPTILGITEGILSQPRNMPPVVQSMKPTPAPKPHTDGQEHPFGYDPMLD